MKNFLKKVILSNSYLTKVVMSFHKYRLKRKFKIQYGKNVFISMTTICEGRNIFGDNSSLVSSVIGYASYLSVNSHISKARIGRYTSIAPNVNCVYGRHPVDTFVSSHPAFFAKRIRAGITYVKKQKFKEFEEMEDEHGTYHVSIGNDVWIGANVSILDGVTIGDGAIVAANALVTQNVEPYSIVGGIPAKFIKHRFSEKHINFLLGFQWWKKEISWIEENAYLFEDIDTFYEKFKKTDT